LLLFCVVLVLSAPYETCLLMHRLTRCVGRMCRSRSFLVPRLCL
jgi:hypothetical protein